MHLLTFRSSLQYLNDRRPLTPLIAAQLPDLFEHSATDEMPRFSPDQAHAFMHGNTARSVIARCLGHLHDAAPKRLEPVLVDDHTGLADVAVSLPFSGKPEAPVVTRLIIEADAADESLNSGCVTQLQRREYQARGFEGRKAVHGTASVLEAVWPSGILAEQKLERRHVMRFGTLTKVFFERGILERSRIYRNGGGPTSHTPALDVPAMAAPFRA